MNAKNAGGRRVAILGATGAVGIELMNLMRERRFRVGELVLLASSRSAGKVFQFRDQTCVVQDVAMFDWDGVDLVFMSAGASVSRVYAPIARDAGAVVIDNSSAFRLDDDVPLVVPEINAIDVRGHHGIIANPNCTTAISLMAIGPIHRKFGVRRVIGASYQAVSGAGASGIATLRAQYGPTDERERVGLGVFAPHPIAGNVIPLIGKMTGNRYTDEEMKLQHEGRKILHHPNFLASITCVRVPVERAHTVALSIECEPGRGCTAMAVQDILDCQYGVQMMESFGKAGVPTPRQAEENLQCLVGRIRDDLVWGQGNGVSLVVVGDQLWKGAALNALQIAELLF